MDKVREGGGANTGQGNGDRTAHGLAPDGFSAFAGTSRVGDLIMVRPVCWNMSKALLRKMQASWRTFAWFALNGLVAETGRPRGGRAIALMGR